MQKNRPHLILASASPRRRELLARLGLPFTVRPAKVNEELYFRLGQPAKQIAANLALAKARAVAREVPSALVLGADTLVVLDERTLSKPSNAAEAGEMLRALRNREHTVLTGVALVQGAPEREATLTVETRVWMRPYTEGEARAYIARGEPFDKAGGYAIQDERFAPVARWEGCYCNVVGLPLTGVLKLLASVEAISSADAATLPDTCVPCLQQ